MRHIVIVGVLLLSIVALRLVWIQVVNHDWLSERAEARRTNVVSISAKRGTIFDRNGNVLAISVDCKDVVCDPTTITYTDSRDDKKTGAADAVADILVEVLGGDKNTYLEALNRQNTRYAYLARRIDVSQADQIQDKLDEANLTGIYYESDTKRVYRYGTTGSQIIGYVNSEGVALSGLEYYYDSILKGTDGQRVYESSASGGPIAGGVSETTEARNGTDIVISIDIDLQYECEEIISEGTETYSADSGSVMVTNPKTGEIYAACSTPLPDFDNITDVASLNLKLVTDSYEPGSVFKVITTSIGIEDGLLSKDTTINIPAKILVGNDWVTDDDGRNYAMDMSVEYALAQSSNVAMAYYAQNIIGAEKFAAGVEKYGIGQKTGIDFPGESQGIVRKLSEYTGASVGSMAFGQSLAVPLVQIVRAYGAIANDGIPNTPHFLLSKDGEQVQWESGERIVSKATADEETDMMRSVMTEGSGVKGQVEGYDIAGKTGTGEQADENGGYKKGSYVASLCGFANADDPEVLVYVGLNGIPYLAAVSAANVFHDVMEQSITILSIPPASYSN
ncbi:penicillin-binding protein 2 [Paratractidigestivibacter sp.]|uniref:peptidoglycan D,D-transpeptidase FtsI family protein n=1 Tax=Paratractidigestivibacter sp. TaxID=2847316 RepID=UPI002AC9B16E|nr:penicillin-binding protein 2 [Paratractidigestivibacter sp.]